MAKKSIKSRFTEQYGQAAGSQAYNTTPPPPAPQNGGFEPFSDYQNHIAYPAVNIPENPTNYAPQILDQSNGTTVDSHASKPNASRTQAKTSAPSRKIISPFPEQDGNSSPHTGSNYP